MTDDQRDTAKKVYAAVIMAMSTQAGQEAQAEAIFHALVNEREAARQEGLEEAAKWCEAEDVEGDPDDLYTGRRMRAAAIRALQDKPAEDQT